MMKKTIALITCLSLFIQVGFTISFSDIRNHWAENDINTLTDNQLVSGYPDGVFKPNDLIKRDEFITFVMRILKDKLGNEAYEQILEDAEDKSDLLPWQEEFDQVYRVLQLPSYWGRNTMLEAVKLRLLPYQYDVTSYITYFRFRADITRGEAAYIMTQAAKLLNIYADRMLHNYVSDKFSDLSSTNPFSDSIFDAHLIGILNGYGDSTIKPDNKLTRAEAVAMLIKLFDLTRLQPVIPEDTPYVLISDVLYYEEPLRYYPALIDGHKILDPLRIVNFIEEHKDLSRGYIQPLYNPENGVLTYELYNSRDDFLALQYAPTREVYISRLAQTIYMTITINPSNIELYPRTMRQSSINSKFNPYQIISWGRGFENSILNNHMDFLEELFYYLFNNEAEFMIDRMEHYLKEGEGGITTYDQYNNRYASWKPLGSGIFIIEVMEEINE
jgi:hypothetical protein